MISEQTISRQLEHLLHRMKSSEPNLMLDGIGLDIESGRSINQSAARFFLTETEQDWLKQQDAPASSRILLRLWTVKEAIFKADPDNTEKILGDYVLEDPSLWAGTAHRRDGRLLRFHYTSIEVDEGFLSIAALARGERDA